MLPDQHKNQSVKIFYGRYDIKFRRSAFPKMACMLRVPTEFAFTGLLLCITGLITVSILKDGKRIFFYDFLSPFYIHKIFQSPNPTAHTVYI
jgi:hypothetical protein